MSEHDPYGEFRFVHQYDSFEDPQLRSDYLDEIGKTRPYINALRRRLDAARKAEKAAGERTAGPTPRGEPRRRSRSPRRPRVVGTRPPNRGDITHAFRRRRARSFVLVIVIRLD
ncbi:hypothetical protein OG379_14780 [Streptomyces sp. NBC_01166]|uniref:hypothetical protein n=1 Tax=Streptomyces sp. NBC_01166 TaxID=2903755 RepID=UPI003869C038|nr:hypothetical protein OG379_14780 [Streptomyces sp. NBC_01166]